jgi:hypothetical protein
MYDIITWRRIPSAHTKQERMKTEKTSLELVGEQVIAGQLTWPRIESNPSKVSIE